MKTKNKILLTSLSGITASAIAAVPLCLLTNQTTINKSNNTKVLNSAANKTETTTVKFTTGSYGTNVTIIGSTSVVGKVGRPLSTIAIPSAKHKNNYMFDGWSTDGTMTGKVDLKTPITKDMVLQPMFTEPTALTKCFCVAPIENTTVGIVPVGITTENAPDLSYTTDFGKNWTKVDFTATTTIKVSGGGSVYFQGNNPKGFSKSASEYVHFTFEPTDTGVTYAPVNIFGNCMALVNGGSTVDIYNDKVPADYCFYHLFENQSNIVNIADNFLPCQGNDDAKNAVTDVLTAHCYDGMFLGCSGLEHAPRLFATTNCVKNTKAAGCYANIFSGCSKLKLIRTRYAGNFVTDVPNQQFYNWVNGISTTGTIIYDGTDTTQSESALPTGWTPSKTAASVVITADDTTDCVVDHEYSLSAVCKDKDGNDIALQDVAWISSKPDVIDIDSNTGKFRAFPVSSITKVDVYAYSKTNITVASRGTIQITVNPLENENITKVTTTEDTKFGWTFVGEGMGPTKIIPKFRYSKDNGATWLDFMRDLEIDMKSGDVILVKGDNTSGLSAGSGTSYTNFTTSKGSISIVGDIKGLIYDGRTDKDNVPIPTDYCFSNLFRGSNIKTINADYLSSFTTLTKYCYSGMFMNCKQFTTTINLPAETLTEGCYESMFQGCTSLVTPPTLNSTKLADLCYNCMFYNCTSLTSTPKLPATDPAKECYSMMFQWCSSLKTGNIGLISLTSLADKCCYQMFAATSAIFSTSSSSSRKKIFYVPNTSELDNPVTRMLTINTYEGISYYTPEYKQTWYA